MTLSVASSSYLAPTGNQNAGTGFAPTLAAPAGLAVGDLYVITTIFQSVTSEAGAIVWPGFTRISATISAGTRLMITQARFIEDSTALAAVATVAMTAGASATRIIAVGEALRSSVSGKKPEFAAASTFAAHASTTAMNWGSPAGGVLTIGAAYSNTGGAVTAPTYTLVGTGTVVQKRDSFADASPTSSNTSLVVTTGGTGVTASPAFSNGGAYALAFAEVDAEIPEDPPEEPDAGEDPGPDSADFATGDDVPTVTWAVASGTDPMTPLSAGWWREKRVGATEAGPGASQSSTAALDLAGSTFFRYPGVPAVDAFAGNPSQYVETPYKPGGSPQAARWLFNVEFVVGATHRVELRLSSPGTAPAIGMILVNGKRIAETMLTADGITGGQGYRVFLDFPTAENRVIRIYGLNGNSGRFGGVAVDDGGWVIKSNRTITRRVAFITDSIGAGAGGAPPAGARGPETWIWDFARYLEADEVVHGGIGGTGFVKTIGGLAESTFEQRVASIMATDPDVLVIQGGQNDVASADVRTAVESMMAATSTVPERIMVSSTQSTAVNAYIVAGLDPDVELVAVQDRPFEIGSDGVHPTFAGHRQLAAAIIERFEDGSPPPPDPDEPNGWQIRVDLLPVIRSLRQVERDATINASSAGGGVVIDGPPTVQIGDYLICSLIFQNGSGATTFQAPDGWTMIGDRGTSGNRMLVTFGRAMRNGTDISDSAMFTVYASTSSTRVAGGVFVLQDIDLDGPVFDVGDWSVATSAVDTLDFTGGDGLRSLTFVYSNSSAGAAISQHSAGTGVKLGQVTSFADETTSSAMTTLSVHYGAESVDFSPSPANAGGLRIAFRQKVAKVGFPARVIYDGQFYPAQLDSIVVGHELRNFTPEPWKVPVKTRTISTLMATNPFYVAHRGSGDLWPEHTMKAYAESVAHGMEAIEVSVNLSSDGVLVCHHDLTTTRMTGAAHTIRTTPWSTLSGLTNTASYTVDGAQPGQPIPRLVDVLDAFGDTHVIFLEAKHSDAATPLLNMMDTYAGSTSRFVWKQYGRSSAGTADAKGRGYKTWGYGYSADLPLLGDWGPTHDYIGVAYACTDTEVQAYVAYGKPTIMWEIHTPADRERALRLGVRGMMTSNIKSVMRTRSIYNS